MDDQVDFAGFIQTEGCDVPNTIKKELRFPIALGIAKQSPDVSRAVIAKKINAVPFWDLLAAVDNTAGHRTAL